MFFFQVIVYAGTGARTRELKVTKQTGYDLGEQARWQVEVEVDVDSTTLKFSHVWTKSSI